MKWFSFSLLNRVLSLSSLKKGSTLNLGVGVVEQESMCWLTLSILVDGLFICCL